MRAAPLPLLLAALADAWSPLRPATSKCLRTLVVCFLCTLLPQCTPPLPLPTAGKHETCDINTFRFGVADRGSSIRIPLPVQLAGKVRPACWDGCMQGYVLVCVWKTRGGSQPRMAYRCSCRLAWPADLGCSRPVSSPAGLPGGPPPRRQRRPVSSLSSDCFT